MCICVHVQVVRMDRCIRNKNLVCMCMGVCMYGQAYISPPHAASAARCTFFFFHSHVACAGVQYPKEYFLATLEKTKRGVLAETIDQPFVQVCVCVCPTRMYE